MSLQCMGLPFYQCQCILQNWIHKGVKEYMTSYYLNRMIGGCTVITMLALIYCMYIFAVQSYNRLVAIWNYKGMEQKQYCLYIMRSWSYFPTRLLWYWVTVYYSICSQHRKNEPVFLKSKEESALTAFWTFWRLSNMIRLFFPGKKKKRPW